MAEYNGKHLVQIQNLLQLAARHVSDMAELTQSVVDAIAAIAVDMKGASSTEDGKEGLVPAPEAGAQEKFLRGDGTWQDVQLPVATKDILGGVKVGDYLDIDADGTISGKTLRNTIAASMAVEAKEMLVWNTYVTSSDKFTTWDIQIPDNIDKVIITKGTCSSTANTTAKEIARGGNTTYSCNYDFTIAFQENGTLHIIASYKTSYALCLWLSGYHYPTFDELLVSKNAVGSDARLVWNTYVESSDKWKTYDTSIPDGVDYVSFKTVCNGYASNKVELARGGTTKHGFYTSPSLNYCTITFQADGTLHVVNPYNGSSSFSNAIKFWIYGYHYPTLADLLSETQAAQADTDALMVDQEYRVTLLELGITDDSTTNTETT